VAIGQVSHVPTGLPWLRDERPPPCSDPQARTIFEEAGELHNPRTAQRIAKTICATCPYFRPCREWAITNGERWGVWGGMNRYERKREAARRGLAAPGLVEGLDDA
jgi:WhiB family redox-sensing transcriptional regulator